MASESHDRIGGTAKGHFTMGDIVNLNKYRKRRRRLEATRKASENRAQFGRDKAERATTQAERERQAKTLDGQRLDRPD
jgi:hypothetical protein